MPSLAGLIQKWYDVTEGAIIDHYRLVNTIQDESTRPLSLVDTQTSFYILGIGLSFCAVVFVLELVHGQCTTAAAEAAEQDYYLVQETTSGINK